LLGRNLDHRSSLGCWGTWSNF